MDTTSYNSPSPCAYWAREQPCNSRQGKLCVAYGFSKYIFFFVGFERIFFFLGLSFEFVRGATYKANR